MVALIANDFKPNLSAVKLNSCKDNPSLETAEYSFISCNDKNLP